MAPPKHPADAPQHLRAQIEGILRDLNPQLLGDQATHQIRHATQRLEELARQTVALDAQHEAARWRRRIYDTTLARADDEAMIRTLTKALSYYADRHNWQHGRAIHVDAFNIHRRWDDEGETARHALYTCRSGYPRNSSPPRPRILGNTIQRPAGYWASDRPGHR